MPTVQSLPNRQAPPEAYSRAATVIVLGLALIGDLDAQTARDTFVAAKNIAYNANYQNDQRALRDAISRFEQLTSDQDLASSALYYAGWTRWVLAASEIVASQPSAATATLSAAVRDLKRGLELRPGDADTHALLAWSLMAIAYVDRARWSELSPDIMAHRRRAMELAPRNPRVMIMDAGMIFYEPPAAGGSQERAIAQWLDALQLFEAERIDDPIRPDWGATLAYGWLANLYLSMNPPNLPEARRMATKALEMRPDFWWVRTQVVPKLEP